jgi:hypothetical protein
LLSLLLTKPSVNYLLISRANVFSALPRSLWERVSF